MYFKIFLIGCLLLNGKVTFNQDLLNNEQFNISSNIEIVVKNKIYEINNHFANFSNGNALDTNGLIYVPVLLVDSMEIINKLFLSNVLDSSSVFLSEIIILLEDKLKPIGFWESCKDGKGYIGITNSRYGYLSSMPCRSEDRLIEKSVLFYKKIKSVLKRTKGQLILIKIKKIEGLYYIKKNSSEITKL